MFPGIIVAIECTCIAFLLVVFAAYIILPRSGKLSKDAFFYCVLTLILGIVFDMISWACECAPSPQWLQFSSNVLCLVISGFINASFAYYVIGLIREKKSISWIYAQIIAAINLCGSIVLIIAAFCGKLFNIIPDSGKAGLMIYESGDYYYVPNYLSAVSLLVLFIIVLKNAKVLGKKKMIVFSIYFLAPLLASGLEILNDNLQISYPITSICISIIYVALQSKHMDELMLKEQLLNEWSYVDVLTNLLNRRAFERDAEAIVTDDSVNVAFCDLNGLKRINDKEGHYAGDRYLIKFSEILTRHFPSECVYRISGDEFVVLVRNTGIEAFNNSIEGLKKEIDENAEIAAIGTTSGPGGNVYDLIKEAESRMYDNKNDYYQKNPSLRYGRNMALN